MFLTIKVCILFIFLVLNWKSFFLVFNQQISIEKYPEVTLFHKVCKFSGQNCDYYFSFDSVSSKK